MTDNERQRPRWYDLAAGLHAQRLQMSKAGGVGWVGGELFPAVAPKLPVIPVAGLIRFGCELDQGWLRARSGLVAGKIDQARAVPTSISTSTWGTTIKMGQENVVTELENRGSSAKREMQGLVSTELEL